MVMDFIRLLVLIGQPRIGLCGWETYFFNLTCTFLELQLVFYNAEFCKPGSGIWLEYFSVRVFLSVLPFYKGYTIR